MRRELTLGEFYAADPRRAHSSEVGYGSLWREFAPVPTYRVEWVRATGLRLVARQGGGLWGSWAVGGGRLRRHGWCSSSALGATTTSWPGRDPVVRLYDCPRLPEELKVNCPECNNNFATGDGMSWCGESPSCQWAAEGRRHAESARRLQAQQH